MYEAKQNKEKVSRRIDSGGGTRQRMNIEDGRRKYSAQHGIIQGKWNWWLSGISKTNREWRYFACDDYPNHSAWRPESQCVDGRYRPFHLTYLDGLFSHLTYYTKKDKDSHQYGENKEDVLNEILSGAQHDFESEYPDIYKAPPGPIRTDINDTKSAILVVKANRNRVFFTKPNNSPQPLLPLKKKQ